MIPLTDDSGRLRVERPPRLVSLEPDQALARRVEPEIVDVSPEVDAAAALHLGLGARMAALRSPANITATAPRRLSLSSAGGASAIRIALVESRMSNSILLRYADDSVMAFESLDDAKRVMDVLGKPACAVRADFGLTGFPRSLRQPCSASAAEMARRLSFPPLGFLRASRFAGLLGGSQPPLRPERPLACAARIFRRGKPPFG